MAILWTLLPRNRERHPRSIQRCEFKRFPAAAIDHSQHIGDFPAPNGRIGKLSSVEYKFDNFPSPEGKAVETKKVRIVDLGRGPQIEGHRLTVMDVSRQ